MRSPEVTVILPVYNGEKYLGESLECALSQTSVSLEVIVVDDGSTDRSAAVVQNFNPPVRYVYQANAGTGAARNAGVLLAKGRFLAFLDQDDLWRWDKLALQMEAFRGEPGLDAVFCLVREFVSPELRENPRKKLRASNRPKTGYLPSAILVKRTSFDAVGPFKTCWRLGEWADWFIRAVELGFKTAVVPEELVSRRLHGTNKGLVDRTKMVEYPRILKGFLDRRRGKPGESASVADEPCTGRRMRTTG